MKVLDTSFLIDFMAGTSKSKSKMQSILHEPLIVSEVTVIELLARAHNSRLPDQEVRLIRNTVDQLNIVPVNEYYRMNIVLMYARLQLVHQMISHFDIVIAGTALALGATLITNDKHFERLQSYFPLKLESWLYQ
jgi:predicted nucleic acid-binding protein